MRFLAKSAVFHTQGPGAGRSAGSNNALGRSAFNEKPRKPAMACEASDETPLSATRLYGMSYFTVTFLPAFFLVKIFL